MTGQQIENDIYGLVKTGAIADAISGNVYKYGMRPRNSQLEDAVVKFVTGLDGQIQRGTVVVNIYVPDIEPFDNGILVRNIARCTEIEGLANAWVDSLADTPTNYLFELSNMVYTEEESEINQHFVTVRIRFQVTNF